MSTEHNRIRLSIESIKLNWNQSNWLVESIELLIELIDRGRSKSIKVGKRCKSSIEFDRPIDHFDWLRLIRPITSNRSHSIETNQTDRSNLSKPIELIYRSNRTDISKQSNSIEINRKKHVNIRLTLIVRSISSIEFDRFHQSVRLVSIEFDRLDNWDFGLTSPGSISDQWIAYRSR